jgi:hypothetical protein
LATRLFGPELMNTAHLQVFAASTLADVLLCSFALIVAYVSS